MVAMATMESKEKEETRVHLELRVTQDCQDKDSRGRRETVAITDSRVSRGRGA